MKSRVTAPLAIKSCSNNLLLLKSLKDYSKINAKISKTASEKVVCHSLYL